MKKKTISVILIAIILIILVYYLESPLFISKEKNEEIPLGTIISKSTLLPDAHEVAGKVVIIEERGNKILRFEDFETTSGPNLHIYLATDRSASDYIDLGKIKATKGNVNYGIPSDVDLEKYDTVLVWCVPFEVLFSYAEF